MFKIDDRMKSTRSRAALTVFLATASFFSQIPLGSAKSPVKVAQAAGTLCSAQLETPINRVLDRVSGARWSVLVQTQGSGTSRQTLFARNPSTLLIPASNNKVFTTAAALRKLGAQYRIRTAVYGSSSSPNLATLRIVGHGDPSLTTTQLGTIAQQLSRRGVRQITQLIGDDTYFKGALTSPFWDAEDAGQAYAAPINSLMLNQNIIGLTAFPRQVGQSLEVQWDDPTDARDWTLNNQGVTVSASGGEFLEVDRAGSTVRVTGQLRTGSESESIGTAIPNPGNYLVKKFRDVLTSNNIGVTNSTLVKLTPIRPDEVELTAVESPPLASLLFETNQESNNTYAEALLKTLGQQQNPLSQDMTQSGTIAVQSILSELGVSPDLYRMVDGSGLADRNRASAEALVQTLQAMAQIPEADVFRRSLAVSGVSGTLKNRFRNTSAQGIVSAKTGTITGVVALSGYVAPPNSAPLVFSLIANSSASAGTVRSAVDDVVVLLTRLRSCS